VCGQDELMEENERAEAEYEKLLNEVEAGATKSQVDASQLERLRKEVRTSAHAHTRTHTYTHTLTHTHARACARARTHTHTHTRFGLIAAREAPQTKR